MMKRMDEHDMPAYCICIRYISTFNSQNTIFFNEIMKNKYICIFVGQFCCRLLVDYDEKKIKLSKKKNIRHSLLTDIIQP